MKKIIFLTMLVLISLQLYSQKVSTAKAIMFSTILPGSGHLYIQQNTKAGFYFAAEIGIIFSYFRFKSEKKWVINSYKNYANSKIGMATNNPENRYQTVQDYFSSDQYNTYVRTYARNIFLGFNSDPESYYEYLELNLVPEDESWHWQTKEKWYKYRELRYKKQDYEILTNFSIAALFLNRFISVIDVAISSRKINRPLKNLTFTPDFKNKGMKISYAIKF